MFAISIYDSQLFIRREQGMKTIKVKQLSVNVGKCHILTLPFTEYQLKIVINRDLYAATSFKSKIYNEVNFATRLFLRMDNPSLQQINKCSVQITGKDDRGNKIQVALGDVNIKQQGNQVVQLQGLGNLNARLNVELEFAFNVVQIKQSKSINNTSSSFKDHFQKKQSSCEQRQLLTSKTVNGFSSSSQLDHLDLRNPMIASGNILKISNSENILCNKSEQLFTSITSAKQDLNPYKTEASQTLLILQRTINQLQQKLSQVNKRLIQCNTKLELALEKVIQEKIRCRGIEAEKEELLQLLTLQQLRNKLALSHIAKMNGLVDQIRKSQVPQIEFIQQKDQIIMMNQELELELAKKNIVISQLQSQLAEFKAKLTQMEDKMKKMDIKSNIVLNQTQPLKKISNLSSKQMEKFKSQKKHLDKNAASWVKKQEDSVKETTKETNNIKDQRMKANSKDSQRKKIKKQVQANKMLPPRLCKEIKAPISPPPFKANKIKSTKNSKTEVKPQDKNGSHIQAQFPDFVNYNLQAGQADNPLLNLDVCQSLSKHPSKLKNSGK